MLSAVRFLISRAICLSWFPILVFGNATVTSVLLLSEPAMTRASRWMAFDAASSSFPDARPNPPFSAAYLALAAAVPVVPVRARMLLSGVGAGPIASGIICSPIVNIRSPAIEFTVGTSLPGLFEADILSDIRPPQPDMVTSPALAFIC